MLFLAVGLSCRVNSQKQSIDEDGRVKEIIQNSEYIFEAIPIQGTGNVYFGSDSAIYGSGLLRITRVFKGDIAIGSIEMLGHASTITYQKPDGSWTQVDKSHGARGAGLAKGVPQIIFASKSNLPRDPQAKSMSIDNPVAIEIPYHEEGVVRPPIIFIDYKYHGPGKKTFLTEKAVLNYLCKVQKLDVPKEMIDQASDVNPNYREVKHKWWQRKRYEKIK